MKKQSKINQEVFKLSKELKDNNGIVPASWKPYLTWIKAGLKVIKIFTPAEINVLINEILAAIEIAETA